MTNEQVDKLVEAVDRLNTTIQEQAVCINDMSGSLRGIFLTLEAIEKKLAAKD